MFLRATGSLKLCGKRTGTGCFFDPESFQITGTTGYLIKKIINNFKKLKEKTEPGEVQVFFKTGTTGGYQYMGYNRPTLVRLRFLTRSAAEGERFLLKFVRILNAGCWKIRSRGTKIRRFCSLRGGHSLYIFLKYRRSELVWSCNNFRSRICCRFGVCTHSGGFWGQLPWLWRWQRRWGWCRLM